MVSDLAAGLTSRGHQVDVFAASGSFIKGANVVDTGVDSHELASSLFRPGRSGPGLPEVERAFEHAYRLIGKGGYDLVHNHSFDAPAIRLGADLGPAVIHTLHLPPDRSIASTIRQLSHSGRTPIVVTVSKWAGAAWSELVQVNAVVRNGVPLNRISWSPEGGEGALFAGRFSPEKGAMEAIEIAVAAGVPISLIGNPYDPAYTALLEDRCRNGPGVTLKPSLDREELWSRMGRASVVLCPARWEEPFGLVAAEAQAAGTPVVAFARGGLTEVIADGVTGALIPEDDLDAAAEAVANAGSFDRAACRHHAESSLSLETTLDGYEELYLEVSRRSG